MTRTLNSRARYSGLKDSESDVPQFFIKDGDFTGTEAVIRGSDYHHLTNVRRIRIGDFIKIRDGYGIGYIAKVSDINSLEIKLAVVEATAGGTELIDITLYLSLIKGGSFESAVQKAVEVGVNRIIPVITERTVPYPGKKINEKYTRWNKIAAGAAKQCMRNNIPRIGYPVNFDDALRDVYSDVKIIAHTGALKGMRQFLSGLQKPDSVSILVGPEGGFTSGEIRSAGENMWVPVTCGSTHLRAETAAVILPSLVLYHWS